MIRDASRLAVLTLALVSTATAKAELTPSPPAPGTVWVVGTAFEFEALPTTQSPGGASPCIEVEVRGAPAPERDAAEDSGASDAQPPPSLPCDAPARSLVLQRGASDDVVDAFELEREVLSARTFYLHGSSSVVDWYECLAPSGESRLLRAVRRAHAGGATLIGRGRAGALLGTWLAAESEELERIERNPRRAGRARLVAGLAAVDWGLFDTGPDASLARVVNQCLEERLRFAAFVEPAAALEVDLAAERATAWGSGSVWILDLRRARRMRDGLRGVLLTTLGSGDVFERTTRAGARREEPGAGGAASPQSGRTVRDALEPAAWLVALEELEGGSATHTLLASDGSVRVTFRREARSGESAEIRATDVLIDVQRFGSAR